MGSLMRRHLTGIDLRIRVTVLVTRAHRVIKTHHRRGLLERGTS